MENGNDPAGRDFLHAEFSGILQKAMRARSGSRSSQRSTTSTSSQPSRAQDSPRGRAHSFHSVFPRAARKMDDDVERFPPSPQSYSPEDRAHRPSSPAFSFTTARREVLSSEEPVARRIASPSARRATPPPPGPGKYDVRDRSLSQTHRPPSAHIGTAKRPILSPPKAEPRPGPLDYTPEPARSHTPHASIGTTRRTVRRVPRADKAPPGPGAYDTFASSFPPLWDKGGGRDRPRSRGEPSRAESPAMRTASPRRVRHRVGETLAERPSSAPTRGCSFGRARRDVGVQPERCPSPGPGAYDVVGSDGTPRTPRARRGSLRERADPSVRFSRGPAFSFATSRRSVGERAKKTAAPGPGSYFPGVYEWQ